MSQTEYVLKILEDEDAFITDSHVVLSSGKHSTGYVNMRSVAYNPGIMHLLALSIVTNYDYSGYTCDMVIGPETLGRTLAQFVAFELDKEMAWCTMGRGEELESPVYANFPPKLEFEAKVRDKRVLVVDDLLTSGGTIKAVLDLVRECGGIPILVGCVVRRSAAVFAEDFGVHQLLVSAELPSVHAFSAADCNLQGPCHNGVPVNLKVGHGLRWAHEHPTHPSAQLALGSLDD